MTVRHSHPHSHRRRGSAPAPASSIAAVLLLFCACCGARASAQQASPVPDTAAVPAAEAAQPGAGTAPATEASQTAISIPPPDLPHAPPPLAVENLPPTEALGDLLTMRGRYLAAIHVFEQLQPRSAMIANKQGIACEHMLMFDRARQNFEEAIRLDPNFGDAYNNLATVYHSQNDRNRAEKLYRKAIHLQPNASAWQNLGALYYSELRFRKGEQAYREALKLDPHIMEHSAHNGIQATGDPRNSAEMHYHLACTFALAGKPDLALDYLRKSIVEGFHDSNRMLHQKELIDLQTTPDFLKMVEDLRKG